MEGQKQVKDAEEYRRRLAENMIHTEGNMKNYVSKIRKNLELALAAIDALGQVKAPTIAGYQAPVVEEEPAKEDMADKPVEEASKEDASAVETPEEEMVETANSKDTEEVSDKKD